MKMDANEKELLESVERGEWKSAKGGKPERSAPADVRRLDPPRPQFRPPRVEAGALRGVMAGCRRVRRFSRAVTGRNPQGAR